MKTFIGALLLSLAMGASAEAGCNSGDKECAEIYPSTLTKYENAADGKPCPLADLGKASPERLTDTMKKEVVPYSNAARVVDSPFSR